MSDPHAGRPVLRAGAAVADAVAAVVLVHGRGGSPRDMLGLAGQLRAPGVAFLAPHAAGSTWYPFSFMAPLEQNEPHLGSALGLLERLVGELAGQGVPPARQLLVGFSQGGCLATEFCRRNPQRYGGVAGLSAGLIGPPATRWDAPAGHLDGTPVFLGCSDVDPHIPEQRVHETAEVLTRMGAEADVRIYPGMGHTVNRDELDALQSLVERVSEQTA